MDVEEALQYLSSTDEEAARLKGRMKGLEIHLKRIKSKVFLTTDGTVAVREATAYNSNEYAQGANEYENAVADHEIIANKRASAALWFEYWRSQGANRRAGAIT